MNRNLKNRLTVATVLVFGAASLISCGKLKNPVRLQNCSAEFVVAYNHVEWSRATDSPERVIETANRFRERFPDTHCMSVVEGKGVPLEVHAADFTANILAQMKLYQQTLEAERALLALGVAFVHAGDHGWIHLDEFYARVRRGKDQETALRELAAACEQLGSVAGEFLRTPEASATGSKYNDVRSREAAAKRILAELPAIARRVRETPKEGV